MTRIRLSRTNDPGNASEQSDAAMLLRTVDWCPIGPGTPTGGDSSGGDGSGGESDDAGNHEQGGDEQAVDYTETVEASIHFAADQLTRRQLSKNGFGLESAGFDVDGYLPRRKVVRFGESATRDGAHSDPPDDAHGQPDYRIVGELGRGGTAIVYQAHQRAVDREVALKFLRDEWKDDPSAKTRFLNEARVVGSMDHPNVIAIHEVCIDHSERVFYAMKRIDGSGWDEQFDSLSQTENIEILLRVADAIRYAHSRGILHRDIKPQNVMLGQFGEVLLADWGLAARYSEKSSKPQPVKSIGGTPAYMAPELAAGLNRRIDFRTDVYLLGAILYHIVAHHPPHRGNSLMECVAAAADNLITPSDIDNELIRIARRAMNTRPEDRYQTVDQFIAAIRDERVHANSNRLVMRAERRIESMSPTVSLESFAFVDSLLVEALELWPENELAAQARRKLQIIGAEAAAKRGDFDLALTLYESAGQSASQRAAEIREQKTLLQADRQVVSRYSVLFTKSPDAGLLVQLPAGEIVEANAMFGKMFGYRMDEVVNRTIPDLKLWVCSKRRRELVERIRADGFIEDFETQFYRSDGSILDVVVAGRQVVVDGKTMMVSTIRDVSKRKQAERELHRSRTRLANLQRLAGLATWSYNIDEDSIVWNDELFALVGRDVESGTPSRDEYYSLVHPEDRQRLRTVVEASIQNGQAYSIKIRQRNHSGEYHEVLVRGEPIRNREGRIVEIYGVSMPTRR